MLWTAQRGLLEVVFLGSPKNIIPPFSHSITHTSLPHKHPQPMHNVGALLPKNGANHIDAHHSRQPLVKGERLVRYEVHAVIVSVLQSMEYFFFKFNNDFKL